MSANALSESDVINMDLDEIKRTSLEFDIDPDELTFPSMAHHMTVRGKLEALVEHGVIDYDDVEKIYRRWKQSKQ